MSTIVEVICYTESFIFSFGDCILKKLLRLLTLACVPFFFVACGGSSSDSVSTYAGHYQGTLTGDPGHEANAGPMEYTLDDSGKLTGTATVNGYPQVLDGSVDSSGKLQIQMWFGGVGQVASMVMTGQINSDNTFSGSDYENAKPYVTGKFSGKKD